MGTTVEKLNKLKTTKEAIRTAINNKGGTLTTSDKFSDYATAIDNIQSGGKEEETKSITITENGTTTVLPTSGKVLSKVDIVANIPQTAESGTLKNLLDNKKSTRYLFTSYDKDNVSDLIKYSDTSNVTDMSNMFSGSYNVTTVPLLDTSKVTNMSKMFFQSANILTIPQFNTSKVTNMSGMFYNCYNFKNFPQLDTSNVTDMSQMFAGTKVQNIKLNTIKVTNMSNMFGGSIEKIDITHMNITSTSNLSKFCYNSGVLKTLIIRNMDKIPTLSSDSFNKCYHFYGTQNDTYNPEGLKDGRIYVPDDKVEALKTATNWSVFADIIVPLSTLVEE